MSLDGEFRWWAGLGACLVVTSRPTLQYVGPLISKNPTKYHPLIWSTCWMLSAKIRTRKSNQQIKIEVPPIKSNLLLKVDSNLHRWGIQSAVKKRHSLVQSYMNSLYANRCVAGCWWWERALAGFHCCPLSGNSEINLAQISLPQGAPRRISTEIAEDPSNTGGRQPAS